METWCWVNAVAAGVFASTLLWRLGRGSDDGLWFVALAGAPLYFAVSPVLCGLVLLGCSLHLLRDTRRRPEVLQAHGRTVLITGCDSGFGHALAKRLSGMGVKVFAGVLDVSGPGAQQLKEQRSENLQVLQMDVTDRSQIETAHEHVRAQVGDAGLWGLVNNAGILHCPIDAELHPISVYRRCMEVNFLAAVNVCQVFLPLLRRSRGRVVNVCSLAGIMPLPTFAAYGASKAALVMFSNVMRLEMSAWGVKVATIQPTGFKTNIFGDSDNLSRYKDEILSGISSDTREAYGETYISSVIDTLTKMPQQLTDNLCPVLDDMCHALLSVRARPMYVTGQMRWLLPFLYRWCPTVVFDSIIMKLLQQAECKPAGISKK